ncbi:hypothetical protein UVI_02008060 [Ustilaginoidea virens]|nr:hypothetical protein UVI_02008060 [Ustilaginoidea virens]
MLYRHSVLVLEKLRKHPQYKDPENRPVVQELSKRMRTVLADLENIKPIIQEEHQEWERRNPAEPGPTKPARSGPPSSYGGFASRDPTLSGNATVLDASENQELAVELAQKELARRDTERQANRHARVYGDTILPSRFNDSQRIDLDLQSQMEAARRSAASPQQESLEPSRRRSPSSRHSVSKTYAYPSISRSKPVQSDDLHQPPPPPPPPPARSLPPPSRPPKEYSAIPSLPHADFPHGFRDVRPPLPPQKVPTMDPLLARYSSSISAHGRPPVPPPKGAAETPPLPKKERLAFKPGAYLENGDPIRSVFLPSKLRAAFLDVASGNTRRGLEMCGILCGTPVNNALFVRCLLIPDQKCTSDTCETENESAIFDYCADQDLMVLGWIHTHPTQTCFMSSRDLHTHAGYQVMMPESIAIVCAPKFTPS